MNSNSTNRRIVNGLQKFAKRIPLAQAFVTGPTCSVNIKDAKRPKVVMSITLELSLCMIATGKPAFHLINALLDRQHCRKASLRSWFPTTGVVRRQSTLFGC